jgi:hypothetical protein
MAGLIPMPPTIPAKTTPAAAKVRFALVTLTALIVAQPEATFLGTQLTTAVVAAKKTWSAPVVTVISTASQRINQLICLCQAGFVTPLVWFIVTLKSFETLRSGLQPPTCLPESFLT